MSMDISQICFIQFLFRIMALYHMQFGIISVIVNAVIAERHQYALVNCLSQ